MSILSELKNRGSHQARKLLNVFIKSNIRLAEAKIYTKFYTNCLDRLEFPSCIYNNVRKFSLPTLKNLKFHTTSLLDQKRLEHREFKSKKANLLRALSFLSDEDFLDLNVAVNSLTSTACWKLERKLLSSMKKCH